MNNNTTSRHRTHFLRGVELVDQGMKEFKVPSENWACPTQYRYGIPQDNYYGELWCNGMDWQPSFWIIEEMELKDPQIQPFIIFEDHNDRQKFNEYDFQMLINGAFYYRRDCIFVKHDDLGIYTDFTWPYLHLLDHEILFKIMKKFQFYHASQDLVEFWMNPEFVPKYIMERNEDEEDRSNRNPKTKHR